MGKTDDIAQNFGIENTSDIEIGSAGNQDLLNDLLAPETSTASPDDVSSIDDAPADKADDKTKKEVDVDDKTAANPDALTDFLLGEEKDVDEIDKDTPPSSAADDDTPPASDDVPPPPDGDVDDADVNTEDFGALANDLFNLGVFVKDEGEEDVQIKSSEEFLDRFNAEKQKGATEMINNFIGQFGKEHQEAFQAIYVNGANPKDYFTQASKIESFKDLDLTMEKNQEAVVRQTLKNQGFEPTDVDAEVEKLKNYGDLEDTSKRHHKVLVKNEEALLKEKANKAKIDQTLKQEQKDEYVNNVRAVLTDKLKTKEFDGIPLNVQKANELQDFLLVDKWKTDTGETLTDFDRTILELKRPENHANKVKVALLLKLLETDPTLSTIQKRGVSKQSSHLFKEVARQKTTAKRAVSDKKTPAKTWWKE